MTLPDPAALQAVHLPLPAGDAGVDDPSVLAEAGDHLFAGPSRTMVGHGTAARLDLPAGLDDPDALRAVRRWLSAVPISVAGGDPGSEPAPVVAIGALPFDRAAPGCLTVPTRLFCRTDDGRSWLAAVVPKGGSGGAPETPTAAALAGELRAWFDEARSRRPPVTTAAPMPEVTFLPPGREYADAVAEAVRAIASGRLTKVVLGRAVDVRFAPSPTSGPTGPAPATVLARLWDGDPSFHAFSVPVPDGTFVGASPELIVARHGETVTSQPLAGTVALPPAADGRDERTAAPDTEAAVARLLASAKDLAEHRLVVADVAAGLATRCVDVEVPDRPTVVRLRSDARLGTVVRARVPAGPRSSDGRCDALVLLGELHPTPAVGGVSRRAALARIAADEPVPRGYWAGPVGWVDGSGDGEWVLAIRSAHLRGSVARVHAGAGIVAGSDPDLELAETSTKLAPVLDALAPGSSSLLAEPLSAEPVPPAGASRRRRRRAPSPPAR